MTSTSTSPHPEPDSPQTTVGNYFVSNYPPYSFWSEEHLPAVEHLLEQPPGDPRLGLYIHVPFCRKRCDFCYFKVYTDQNAKQILAYLDAVIAEAKRAADRPYLRGRRPQIVYFGGGTPSYLSVAQLEHLFRGLQQAFPFDQVEELTFECEPGTLADSKLQALRDLGVTRLSLGVENFSPRILEINNRAHRAKEIYRAYGFARELGFPQINLDLIAGMVGETDANWQDCIEQTLKLLPESVTVYQLEVPYNTTLYERMKEDSTEVAPVADWDTKRRWTDEAFSALEGAGYTLGSAYTAKIDEQVQFRYRDALFSGLDLLGLGVSSFSHLGGLHVQSEHQIGAYLNRVQAGALPHLRALELTAEERLIREFVLQLKLGEVRIDEFQRRHGVNLLERFRKPLEQYQEDGFLDLSEERIVLRRSGLLQVDRLLHAFFLKRHQNARYA